jgi:hypothetical protein
MRFASKGQKRNKKSTSSQIFSRQIFIYGMEQPGVRINMLHAKKMGNTRKNIKVSKTNHIIHLQKRFSLMYLSTAKNQVRLQRWIYKCRIYFSLEGPL